MKTDLVIRQCSGCSLIEGVGEANLSVFYGFNIEKLLLAFIFRTLHHLRNSLLLWASVFLPTLLLVCSHVGYL